MISRRCDRLRGTTEETISLSRHPTQVGGCGWVLIASATTSFVWIYPSFKLGVMCCILFHRSSGLATNISESPLLNRSLLSLSLLSSLSLILLLLLLLVLLLLSLSSLLLLLFANSIIILSPFFLPVELLLQHVALFLSKVISVLMETLSTNMKLCSLMTHFDIWSNVLLWDLFYWQHSDRGLCRIPGRLMTAYVNICIINMTLKRFTLIYLLIYLIDWNRQSFFVEIWSRIWCQIIHIRIAYACV